MAVNKFLMELLLMVLRMLDSIFAIFRQLAGLEKVQTKDGEIDLLNFFLQTSALTKVFYGILIVAAVICAVSIIVAIVKATVNLSGGERKSIARISGQGVSTTFVTLAMAGIMISGITFASTLLQYVHSSFENDEHELSSIIFDFSMGSSNSYVPDYDNPDTDMVVETYEYPWWEVDENGDKQRVIFRYVLVSVPTGWKDGKSIADFDVWSATADQIYGRWETNWLGYEDTNKKTISVVDGPLIEKDSFNFLLAYFAGVLLLVAVCSACLGLVKRIYDLVILFLSLPLMVATIPLDDGARFKVWRETVVSKVVIAYGAVIAVNVFLLIVPIIQNVSMADTYNLAIMKALLLVGGGLSISGGILLFARLFGTDAAESRDLAQSARTLLAGGTAAVGGLKWATDKATGLASPVLRGAGKGAGKVANLLDTRKAIGGGPQSSALSGVRTGGLGSFSGHGGANASAGSSLGNALQNAGNKYDSGIFRNPSNGQFMNSTGMQKLESGKNSALRNRLKTNIPNSKGEKK